MLLVSGMFLKQESEPNHRHGRKRKIYLAVERKQHFSENDVACQTSDMTSTIFV